MKTPNKHPLVLPALIVGLGLVSSGRLTAQVLTTLHHFAERGGLYPQAGVVLSGDTLYGTVSDFLHGVSGTVFAVKTNGSSYRAVHFFTGKHWTGTNADGAHPMAELILSGNTLYGTASSGGNSGRGTVFRVNTDGGNFAVLHHFANGNSDGAGPVAPLTLSGNTLYGTASYGGTSGNGTVFKVNTDGTGFRTLHSFAATFGASATNNEGASPSAGVVLSGNTLYGTASLGGPSGNGTVFRVNTNGMGFTVLHSFHGVSDGANPHAELILSGNILYGTTVLGGPSSYGTVFAVNTDGTGFTNLHDGGATSGPFVLSGNSLYGTSGGRIFKVNTNGTDFEILHSFRGVPTEGQWARGGLILSSDTLYGTTEKGGHQDAGTVFSFSLLPPQLTIVRSGANVTLSWPAGAQGFALQAATNLSLTNLWSPVAHSAVTNWTDIYVTIPATAEREFFRLSSQ